MNSVQGSNDDVNARFAEALTDVQFDFAQWVDKVGTDGTPVTMTRGQVLDAAHKCLEDAFCNVAFADERVQWVRLAAIATARVVAMDDVTGGTQTTLKVV